MSASNKDKNTIDHMNGNDSFESLMKEYESGMSEISEGDTVEAVILSKEDDIFYLDLGSGHEGEIKCNEFIDPESLLPGDKVEVYISFKKGRFYKCSTSRKDIPSVDSAPAGDR